MMTARFILFFSTLSILCLSSGSVLGAPPVIIIDPGHGGRSIAGSLAERSNSSPNNATSPGGLREKDLTLEFSRILHDEILKEAGRAGINVGVLMTRNDDRNLNFVERAAIANRPDTACVVSIHFNAGGGGKALGSLALISSQQRNTNYAVDEAFGRAIAEACNAGVRKYIPSSKSRGIMTDGHLHGGLGSNFFFQMARHRNLRTVPKCFLEVEFIDNPAVEKALLRDGRAEKFQTIARSVAIFLVEWAEPKAKQR
ncbi:MAG: N-acetylmuramoyl-L-alanine amidase [Verrucomicrobiales bacterium]|nr:N-acetylmuramoyl-L-alanine amidase [Verrucomicrobiales bacterium]